MELSRMQEEILLAIAASRGALCELELLRILNNNRPEGWRKYKQPALNRTLLRMRDIDKNLLKKVPCENQGSARVCYRISEVGTLSLIQSEQNRIRLQEKYVYSN